MKPNINPETGIRYGYISAQSIHPDILYDVIDVVGENLTVAAAGVAAREIAEREAEGLEDEVRIAMAETGGWIGREYEHVWDEWVEQAYMARGCLDREDFIERRVEVELDDFFPEEPIIEFEYEGVKGRTSWLGGACNLWIFESPHTGLYQECSPCVPGAGNLNQPDPDGVLTYDVPADWRTDHDLP